MVDENLLLGALSMFIFTFSITMVLSSKFVPRFLGYSEEGTVFLYVQIVDASVFALIYVIDSIKTSLTLSVLE